MDISTSIKDNQSEEDIGNNKNITDKLQLRENNRQQECDKRRQDKINSSAETEQTSYFRKVLFEKCTEIEKALKALKDVNISQLPAEFDKINKDIISLQRYVASSTLFLKVYDIRKSQEVTDSLKQTFQQMELELLPKKKFGFKARKAPAPTTKDPEDSADSREKKPVISLSEAFSYIDTNFGFSNKKNENLVLTHETISKKDVSLTNLEECTVQLLSSCSSLAMIGLKRCRILAGPVNTSVFVEDCSDCVFVVPCQQLRVHDTTDSDFYIHVTSRAIIEDTKRVKFAPYNWTYPELGTHYEEAGLDLKSNHWDTIDDFNWLAIDKPSPNWCILAEEDRIVDWTLADTN